MVVSTAGLEGPTPMSMSEGPVLDAMTFASKGFWRVSLGCILDYEW